LYDTYGILVMKENKNIMLKAESSHLQEFGKKKDHIPYRKAIIRELMTIGEEVVESCGEYYKMRDFINNDYIPAIKRRIEIIKKKHNGLHYDNLNADTIFKNLNKKQKLKAQVLKRIEDIANKNSISDFNQILDLYMIILAIQDFALGGNAEEIADNLNAVPSSILYTAKHVFMNQDLYSIRFYNSRNLKKDILSIAEDVNNGKIRKSN